MGASSSVINQYHIHISFSTKFIDDNNILSEIISSLRQRGYKITTTDLSYSASEICNIIRNSDILIYCVCQTYSVCAAQAIEYSYLSENPKKIYNIIIDKYKDETYLKHIKELFDKNTTVISSKDDIHNVIREITYHDK